MSGKWASNTTRVRWRFEYTESVCNIQARKAHLLRSSNQEEAKQHILEKLDDNSSLVIMDWAMKFLPVKWSVLYTFSTTAPKIALQFFQ